MNAQEIQQLLHLLCAPKDSHIKWNKGSLSDWIKFKENFQDLSKEFNYSADTSIKRLLHYTDGSIEHTYINQLKDEGRSVDQILEDITEFKRKTKRGTTRRRLDVLYQGRSTVELYAAKFLQHCHEIEQVYEKKFSNEEKCEAFYDGLNDTIKRAIACTTYSKGNFMEYVSTIAQVEANLKGCRNHRSRRR